MAAKAVFLPEVGEGARDDRVPAREADRSLVVQAIDIAVPRAYPAGAEQRKAMRGPAGELASLVKSEIRGCELHESIIED
jgi:hypothetical protein